MTEEAQRYLEAAFDAAVRRAEGDLQVLGGLLKSEKLNVETTGYFVQQEGNLIVAIAEMKAVRLSIFQR